jgi:hypothetical protein
MDLQQEFSRHSEDEIMFLIDFAEYLLEQNQKDMQEIEKEVFTFENFLRYKLLLTQKEAILQEIVNLNKQI